MSFANRVLTLYLLVQSSFSMESPFLWHMSPRRSVIDARRLETA
jgi:hypothetical protein